MKRKLIMSLLVISMLFAWISQAKQIWSEETIVLQSWLSLQEFENLLSTEKSRWSENVIKEIVYQNGEIRWWMNINKDMTSNEIVKDIIARIEDSNQQKLNLWSSYKSTWKLIDLMKNFDMNKTMIIKLIIDWNDTSLTQLLSWNIKDIEIKNVNWKKILNLLNGVRSFQSWAPQYWYTEVSQTMANNTFVFSNVSAFSGNHTYEHETQIYDNDYADYGWVRDSNLPDAYKDTQFLDDIDNFTIWSADASLIQTNTEYYTNMTLTAWTPSSATIRIKWQIGFRWPSYCYSTWCIFAEDTTPTLVMWYGWIYGICRNR